MQSHIQMAKNFDFSQLENLSTTDVERFKACKDVVKSDSVLDELEDSLDGIDL